MENLTDIQLQRIEEVKRNFSEIRTEISYNIENPQEIMLECGAGILLRTVIYRPVTDEKIPVIVVRSAYPQFEFIQSVKAEEYARRGYGYVCQYCRGTGGSEGEWEPNAHEREDGLALLNWLDSQEWVESIGYLGNSYLALTGWTVADCVPSKVKTMYLTHYGVFRHTSAYQNGEFRHDVLTSWAMGNAGAKVTADYEESCMFKPQIEVDEKLWGVKLDWYREWILNVEKQDAYWNTGFWGMLKEIPSRVKIPVCIGEGWFDHHLQSALETWNSLPDNTKKMSRLCIGGWNHNFDNHLEGKICANLKNNDDKRAFDWFETVLKRKEIPDGRIEYYLIGEDQWKVGDWNEQEAPNCRKLYLGEKNGYILSMETTESGTAEYIYDPNHPVYSCGGEALLRSMQIQGSRKQMSTGSRSDILCFRSKPLEESMYIYGAIKVFLSVASDADDTAFSVKISEEESSGETFNIRTGITTLCCNEDGKNIPEYIPGSTRVIIIKLWKIAWKLKKGSRIRLDISSSDFPQYHVHSNYAGKWALQGKAQKAHQKVFFGEGSSFIEIPVMEEENEKTDL